MAIIGKLIALCDIFLIRDSYRHFVDIYNNSPVKRFLMALSASVVFVLIVWFIMLGVFGENKSGSGLSSEQCMAIAVVAGIVFMFPCMSSISRYRQEFITCPKCRHETKIATNDLLSENVISERKKDSNKKLKIEHYRVGTRLVTIACQSCDYTKGYELKFKEKA